MSVESITSDSIPNPAMSSVLPKPAVEEQQVRSIQAQRVLPAEQASRASFTQQELSRSIEQIQVMMDLRSRAVEFVTDESSGAQVVKVVDTNSGDVIRQMPAEELLSFMRNLTKMLGTFIDQST